MAGRNYDGYNALFSGLILRMEKERARMKLNSVNKIKKINDDAAKLSPFHH